MNTQAAPTRRYHLDWLRVVAIAMIFVYHSGRFFTVEDWHVKNAQRYAALDDVGGFLAAWGMPLIFVISGASTFYALGKRGQGSFLKDRSLRLLVPLAVGAFTHGAWQVYLERLTHGQFQGSFWAFLPHYFDGMYGFGGNFAWMGLHLWYLEMLWLFSLVCLPLLWWLRRGSGMHLLNRLSPLLARPGGVYLLALPVLPVAATIDPATPLGIRVWGGWSLVAHLLFFLSGFVLVAHDAVEEQIERLRWISLAAGVMLVGLIAALRLSRGEPAFGTWAYTLEAAPFSLNTWCWILAVWGFARRHLDFATSALWHANEGVLPFYILHQTVLLSVGYVVVQWAIPDPLKWLVISVASLIVILGTYALLIRRYDILRILFGMKRMNRV